jgi:glycosyltransferase involved in cell wall biosynthesis
MNIAWLTVRKWDDLCTTTTDALAHGLIKRGHNLTIINGEAAENHASKPWSHIPLKQSQFPGRSGASLARSAVVWFQKNSQQSFDVVIVDWPLAPGTATILGELGHWVVLMDRSPPANISIFGKLQWRVWRNAWNLVNKGVIQRGVVVSEAHKKFVHRRMNTQIELIEPVPAGVDLNRFQFQNKEYDGTLKMIYHGQLDKHRGVLALPMLARKLMNHGINVELNLVGEGDAYNSLRAITANEPFMTVSPKKTRAEISVLLQSQHIGLLPMPNTPVWSLASPLKRSEYLASGLIIYGIDHAGHQMEHASPDWFRLTTLENFHEHAIEWLKNISEEELREGSRSSREYAEAHSSWKKSIDILEKVLYHSKSEE